MTRMTGPDCVVMCNLINTHTNTHTHTPSTHSVHSESHGYDKVSQRLVHLDERAEEIVSLGIEVQGILRGGVEQLELVRLLNILRHHLCAPRADKTRKKKHTHTLGTKTAAYCTA